VNAIHIDANRLRARTSEFETRSTLSSARRSQYDATAAKANATGAAARLNKCAQWCGSAEFSILMFWTLESRRLTASRETPFTTRFAPDRVRFSITTGAYRTFNTANKGHKITIGVVWTKAQGYAPGTALLAYVRC
jgi:hypothetical protein